MPIFSSSKQWSNQARQQDRSRRAKKAAQERRIRRARADHRREIRQHPARSFFRWAVK